MSKELVERLRSVTEDDAYAHPWTFGEHCKDAADLIERQAKVIEELHNLGTNHFPFDGPNGPCEKALDAARALSQ